MTEIKKPVSSYQSDNDAYRHANASQHSKHINDSETPENEATQGEEKSEGTEEDLVQCSSEEVLAEYQAARGANPPSSFVVIRGKVFNISMIEQYLASMGMMPESQAGGNASGQSTAAAASLPSPNMGMSKQIGNGSSSQASTQAANLVSQMQAQGYSDQAIYNKLSQVFGGQLSQNELMYLAYGMGGYNPNAANQYGSHANGMNGSACDPIAQSYMEAEAAAQCQAQSQDMIHKTKKEIGQQRVKMNMILLQILMGDIAGAFRSYWILAERDSADMAKIMIKKLEKIRDAKGTVMRNFGKIRQVKPYVGDNPRLQANNTYRQQRTQQLITVTNQLIGELGSTEKEVLDGMQTVIQRKRELAEEYTNIRDKENQISESLLRPR